jgi:hypothetical protein
VLFDILVGKTECPLLPSDECMKTLAWRYIIAGTPSQQPCIFITETVNETHLDIAFMSKRIKHFDLSTTT